MYFKIIFKTIFLYFFIVVVYRVMGKKEVGKLSIVDLIVSILIAELAAISIEKNSASIFVSIVPITVLVIIQLILGYVTLKNEKVRKLIDGKPTIIINNGKINFTEMVKLRYSLDDLITQLREQGVKNIEEVDYAVLENDGKLSVFKETKNYPMPIIMDGKIDYEVLNEIGKNEKWLTNILKDKNLKVEDIFYAFDTGKKTFIITKNDLLWLTNNDY